MNDTSWTLPATLNTDAKSRLGIFGPRHLLDAGRNAGPFPISGRWVWRGGTPSRAPTPRHPVASSRRSRSAMLVISVTITHPPRNNGFESRCYSEPIRAVHTAHQPIG